MKNEIPQWLADNVGTVVFALITFLEIIARLTPSKYDNTVLEVLKRVLNLFIKNRRKGGGTHA